MTEVTPNEHESNESDEDCEVYFLKPVNEYNIVEKIKEANKVLFEETTEPSNEASNSKNVEVAGAAAVEPDTVPTVTRKVTFAPNLETYEPDNSNAEALQLTREFAEAVAEAKELDRKLTKICGYETILEETNAIVERENDVTIDQSVAQMLLSTEIALTNGEGMPSEVINKSANTSGLQTTKTEGKVENDIVEEICEEIEVMDMENGQAKAETANTKTVRRMYKLPTFDCAEEDPPEIIEATTTELEAAAEAEAEEEQDNKSMVNLMTSDGEEECCSAATFDINVDNSDLEADDIDADTFTYEGDNNAKPNANVYEDEGEANSINTSNDLSNTEGYGDDDDEDDDLSIIVASYLPVEYDKQRLTDCGRVRSSRKSRRLLAPLSKHFNFHRKPLNRNAIGAAFADSAEAGGGSRSSTSRLRRLHPHQPPPEVTDLKFNYRTCCEYRRQLSQPEKLPKYTGYLSEYGLSRQQLELREESLQRKQRFALQQALNVNDAEMRKMQDNERAFTTWLRNKMRFPINKTRNMFDVKRRSSDAGLRSGGGSSACGANSAVRNASGKRK